jgi:hypothetical protein
MKRRHVLIALLIGAAALAGTVAAARTMHLGRASASPALSSAQIAARNRALDRAEASLRHVLRPRPATPAARRTLAAKVVYVRPKPHVVTVHRSHGGEHEAEGRERDGGELDD